MKNHHTSETCCAVTAATADQQDAAHALAQKLGLPLVEGDSTAPGTLLLELTPQRLQLRESGPAAPGAVAADFLRLGYRVRQGSLRRESIARACGMRGNHAIRILDATAGLGRDGFMLAALGARVDLVERSSIVVALLADGLKRAAAEPALAAVTDRITLRQAEATTLLKTMPAADRPDVVYLDPMYPESGTRAQVKKEMQLLRSLLGADPDPAELLQAALLAAARRVVVKRPLRAAPITGPRPGHSLEGRSTRFDVYPTG